MANKPKTVKAPKPPKTSNPSLKMIEFTASSIADAITATGAKKSGKLLLVPVDNITEVPGFNLRIETPEYLEGIQELKQSMLLEGFYDSKPISGFAAQIDGEDKIVVIDGHRRFAAAKAAIADGMDLEVLPVVLKKPTSSALDLAVSLHKENTSVGLSMLERAVLAHRMLRAGENEDSVAERLQVTVRHVNDLKVLMAAPRAIRDLVKDGKLAATEAVTQLRKDPTGAKLLEAMEKTEKAAADKIASKGGVKEAKLTRQTIEGDGTPAVKMQVHRANFQVTAGATFVYEDAEPYLRLLGDDTWFKAARKKTERIALETVSVEVKIRRPKSAAETEAEAEAATTAADAKAKGGRPKRSVPDELDDGLGGDDDDGAPDLRALGIAEPAGASAEL